MPQVFQVLCCYSCEMFQVHFVKKSNKWQCKVCNKKQSLKKAFKIGGAHECRSLVQELNMQRGCQKLNINTEEEETVNTIIEERHVLNSNEVNEEEELVQFSGYNKPEDEELVQFSGYNKSEDDSIYDRFFPDNTSDFHNESATRDDNFLAEDIEFTQTYEVRHSKRDAEQDMPEVCENIKNCDEQKKRLYEHSIDISSQASLPPPFKKNRGFQIIKSAASKLS